VLYQSCIDYSYYTMSTTTIRTRCQLSSQVSCGPYTALDQLGINCSDVRISSIIIEV